MPNPRTDGRPGEGDGEGEGEGDDQDIELALARGDTKRALNLLMERYGDRVYRFAVALTGAADLAEEVRQRVFVDAYRDFDRCTGRIRPWLFGIARHRAQDATKATRRWNRRYKNELPAESELVEREPHGELDRGRLARMLARCLAKLAPAARDAIVLRYHQELSYDEAAEAAGALPGTLQQRVARALPVLRSCLEAALEERKPS